MRVCFTQGLFKGFFPAAMVSTAFAVGWVLLLVPVTRKLITRFLPGEGVVREERDMF